MRYALTVLTILCVPLSLLPITKQELAQRYKGKFLVVLRDGLAVGACANHAVARGLFGTNMPGLAVRITEDKAEYHEQTGFSAMTDECGAILPEPLHKGEVLKVDSVYLRYGHNFTIAVDTLSPHAVERGVGAYGHQSFEQGRADLIFLVSNHKDFDAAVALVETWVRVFDSQDEAAKFGNTASGVFVKEVKSGMSFAEVESALGPPQTRIDLAPKVLYKYKDMTVEFRDGKVSDVR